MPINIELTRPQFMVTAQATFGIGRFGLAKSAEQCLQGMNATTRQVCSNVRFRGQERTRYAQIEFSLRDPSETWQGQAPSSRYCGSIDAGYSRTVEFAGSCSRQNPNASCAARSDRLNSTHSFAAVR